MAYREGLGGLLADGSKLAAEKIGKGSEKYAMHVKGLELPAYDVGPGLRPTDSILRPPIPVPITAGGMPSRKFLAFPCLAKWIALQQMAKVS
jgi:hypothetical protein